MFQADASIAVYETNGEQHKPRKLKTALIRPQEAQAQTSAVKPDNVKQCEKYSGGNKCDPPLYPSDNLRCAACDSQFDKLQLS